MNLATAMVLLFLGIWAFFALRLLVRRAGSGGCFCGGGDSCGGNCRACGHSCVPGKHIKKQ